MKSMSICKKNINWICDFVLRTARRRIPRTSCKFEIVAGEKSLPVSSLDQTAAIIRKLGSEGIEIKRFKGLGEMNAEQLWETTMNPQNRTLLKVEMENAGEADRLFSILMGDDVEKRRKFIQEHALEVQNLDI